MADLVLESYMEKFNLEEESEADFAEAENEASQDQVFRVLFYPKLLDHIFKYLDLKSLLVAQEVCETWHDVSKLSLERRLTMKIEAGKLPPLKFLFSFKKSEFGVHAERPSSEVADHGDQGSNHEETDSDGEGDELPAEIDTSKLLVQFHTLPPAREKYRRGSSAQWQTILESNRWIVTLSAISFHNVLTVQEWNGLWPVVLRDFKALQYLNLTLPWYPDEKPMTEVEITPDEAIPSDSLRILRIQVVVDEGSTAKFGGGIDTTFFDMCPEMESIILSYIELAVGSPCMCSSSELITIQACVTGGDDSDEANKPWEMVLQGPSGSKFPEVNVELFSAITSAIVYFMSTRRFNSLQFIRELSILPYLFSQTSVAANAEHVKLITYDYAAFNFADLENLGNLPKLKDVAIVLVRKDVNEPPVGWPAVPVQLESVQRLELGLSNFGAEELGHISSTIFEMMPNLTVLVTVSMRVTVDLEFALEEGLGEAGVDAGVHCDLLSNIPKLKKLKHFIWDWTLQDSFNDAFLKQVTECLSKCEALETLTVRFGDPSEGLRPRLDAIVDGCSKAPNVRALWIFLEESDELVELQQPGIFPDFVRVADSRLDFTTIHYGEEWRHLEEPLPDPSRFVLPLELRRIPQ